VIAAGRSADDAIGDRKKSLRALECSAEQKRPVMHRLAEEYPVTQICEVWGSARSSYYRRKAPTDEAVLHEAIERLAGEWPTYGYRRITQQLGREGWTVNHKRVERLMCAAGLAIHRKAKRRTTTDSSHPFPRYPNLVEQLEIVRPEQVWVSDVRRVGAYGIPVEDRRG
jgi:putative transposase